jgi:hypothetical protein
MSVISVVAGTISGAQNTLQIGLYHCIDLSIDPDADFNPVCMEEIDGLGPHPSRDHQIYSLSCKKGRENAGLMAGIGNIHPLGDRTLFYREDGIPLTVTEVRRDNSAFFGDSDFHGLSPITATATAAETTAAVSTTTSPGNATPAHAIDGTEGGLRHPSLDLFRGRRLFFSSLFIYFLYRIHGTAPATPPSGAGSASHRTGSIKTWHTILHLIITHMRKNLNMFL